MFYTKDHPLLYFPEIAGKSLHWYCGDDLENYNQYNKKGWEYHNTACLLYTSPSPRDRG